MHPFASHALIAFGSTFGFVLFLALGMTIAPRRVQDAIAKAPLLDVAVALMTWAPWVVCGAAMGWAGLLGSVLGGPPALMAWSFVHEQMNREALRGPRIVKFVNRTVGRWQNHLALWVTAIALPVFWGIRIAEIFVYPLLPLLLKFPKYKQSEWINVTRQKFSGLVGHDLIWCLYCDWMTGVYSLGAEMLRNVESFWCPIRYYDGKKCDHCKIEFPDIENGWVPAGATMTDVEAVMEKEYGDGRREWFGHPARLTVRGEEIGERGEG
ncbi:MAG TPA: hypothetical protein VF624_11470 [Tepidisphaeraceae bacterium]|jgi:hypothetical protein